MLHMSYGKLLITADVPVCVYVYMCSIVVQLLHDAIKWLPRERHRHLSTGTTKLIQIPAHEQAHASMYCVSSKQYWRAVMPSNRLVHVLCCVLARIFISASPS